jgi:hypothetical protein
VHGAAERVHIQACPNGQPGQREAVPPRTGQCVADRAGIRVTGLGHRPPDPGAGVTERVGQSGYRDTERVLEQELAERQLAAQPVPAELVELRVPVAVRADLYPGRRRLRHLAPGQHPGRRAARRVTARVRHPAGGHEHRRGETVLAQQRQRPPVEVGEAVIEGEHHGSRRDRDRRRQLARGDGGEAVGGQVAELGGEIPWRYAQPAAALGAHGDVVVHQDRNHDQLPGELSRPAR